jgi:hypothetical protein
VEPPDEPQTAQAEPRKPPVTAADQRHSAAAAESDDIRLAENATGNSGNAGWVRWLLGAAAEVAATHDLTLTVHC